MVCLGRLGLVAVLALGLAAIGTKSVLAQAQSEPPKADAPKSEPPKAEPPKADAPKPEAFGEEVTLVAKTMLYFKGSATWDRAFETLLASLKTVNEYAQKQGLKPVGPPMTVYTSTDDTGFQFLAGVPLAEDPKQAPTGDLSIGKSPEGAALKFIHRGTYDSMESTYSAITNYLDERQLEAKDQFIEQYVTDPFTTPEDKLVIEVYVPIK
jgi:effector-binding domain-containing protein